MHRSLLTSAFISDMGTSESRGWAGAPGKKHFLFPTGLNVGEYKPTVVRGHHMEPDSDINSRALPMSVASAGIASDKLITTRVPD